MASRKQRHWTRLAGGTQGGTGSLEEAHVGLEVTDKFYHRDDDAWRRGGCC